MGFDFSLVDVFTDRPFGGNRLAVLRPDPGAA
jgi:predicted PhzF superfamily epimerase YddE/YHI9